MNRHRRPRFGRGFTILEIVVSMILLGSVLAIVVPLTKRAVDQRRQAETRRAALIEVSNALERLAADPTTWPEPGTATDVPLPDRLAARLREPRLVVASAALSGPPSGRRFDASLTWAEPTGGRSAPLRLSAFAFESGTGEGGEP